MIDIEAKVHKVGGVSILRLWHEKGCSVYAMMPFEQPNEFAGAWLPIDGASRGAMKDLLEDLQEEPM